MSRRLALFAVLLSTCILRTCASNNYPIVLVHGVAGWGRDELAGFKYWGGFYGDYQKQLREEGFQVYSAAVGPFSSNWDRACELYAQIKGGRVDYGANHSVTHGHARYGRTYPGFFPQWGQVIDGHVQKVHLIGHSLGGTTIRMLAQLLNRGTNGSSTEEEDAVLDSLFAGGKDWVHSITTISSPNQGSLVADTIRSMIDLMEDTMTSIFAIAGGLGKATSEFYDAKLDQWSIRPKQTHESLKEYLHRVLSSRMFAPGFRDIAAYSLTTRGAQEENDWVQTLPNIYYYSFVTQDTFAWRDWLFRPIQLPVPFSMTAFLQPSSTLLGSRFTTFRGFDEQWQVNDGMVSLPSQTSDGRGRIVPYKDRSLRGVWNVFEPLPFVDHIGMMGLKLFHNVFSIYLTHSKLLRNLPPDGDADAHMEDNVLQNVLGQLQTDVTQAQIASSMAKCAQLNETDDREGFFLCEQFKQAHNTTKL